MKIYIDGHCDTLSETLDNNEKISNTQYCFNTIDAKQLAPVIQMSAVFINPKFENGFERANNIIDYYFKNMENTVIIKNKKDIQYVIEQKKIGIILTIENGKAIESDLNNIDKLYEKMRYSDPVSSPEVAQENEKINELIAELPGITESSQFEAKCLEIEKQLDIRKIKNTKEQG